MSQADVALLWMRLDGWASEDESRIALEYLAFAEAKAPDSANVMLHRAAMRDETGGAAEGERELARALKAAPEDPQVLATAILWYADSEEARESNRDRLGAWAQALSRSAQTAFHFTELAEYALRVAHEPQTALDQLHRALTLDATWWRTYALAGEALEELDRCDEAIRAYYTALSLTGHRPSGLRTAIRWQIEGLQRAREGQ